MDLSYDFDKEQSAATKKFLVGIPYKSLVLLLLLSLLAVVVVVVVFIYYFWLEKSLSLKSCVRLSLRRKYCPTSPTFQQNLKIIYPGSPT